MKLTKIFPLCILTAVALAGCAGEEQMLPDRTEPAKGTRTLTLTAAMPGADTRATVDENYRLLWQDGDAIAVVGDNGATITLTLDEGCAGKADGSFSGTIPGSFTPKYAIYPASIASSVTQKESIQNPGDLSLKIPGTFDYGNGNLNCPMMAEITDITHVNAGATANLTLRHLGGVVCFDINDIPVDAKKVRLTVHDDQVTPYLSGSATVTKDGDSGYILEFTQNGAGRIIEITNLGTSLNNARFYFHVPARNYKNGVSLTIFNENNETIYTLSDSKDFTIKRGDIALYPGIRVPTEAEEIEKLNKAVATEHGTYKMVRDLTISNLNVSKDFTLDLNGNKLKLTNASSTDGYITCTSNGSNENVFNLTITDTSQEKQGNISIGNSGLKPVIYLGNNSKLKILAGNILNGAAACIETGEGTTTVIGDEENHDSNYPVISSGTYPWFRSQGGTISIESGRFSGPNSLFELYNTHVYIHGGNFTATSTIPKYFSLTGGASVSITRGVFRNWNPNKPDANSNSLLANGCSVEVYEGSVDYGEKLNGKENLPYNTDMGSIIDYKVVPAQTTQE